MSFSKRLAAVIVLCTGVGCHAAEPHRYACPSPLMDGNIAHALHRAEVYDGPPEKQASLESWSSLKGADVYLSCHYEGTDKIVTIHAVGATSCDATDKPAAAFCR